MLFDDISNIRKLGKWPEIERIRILFLIGNEKDLFELETIKRLTGIKLTQPAGRWREPVEREANE